MANKQFGNYVHHITLVLSFSEMEGWEANWSPMQHTENRLQRQFIACKLKSVPLPPRASCCRQHHGLGTDQAPGVAAVGMKEHQNMHKRHKCLSYKRKELSGIFKRKVERVYVEPEAGYPYPPPFL